jgi:hypothetical protein
MFRKISITLLVFVFVLFFGCKKKNNTVQDNIAYQTVNFNVYPGDPLYTKLSVIGGWMYFDKGVNGIIIYRKTMQDFVAIERTSTHLPNDPDARVKVQTDNFTLKDTISNSKWQITDGSILSGPATLPLRLYATFYDNGTGTLNVRN